MPRNQTKQALVALAVNDLAKCNDYDSITVDMICERANISRSGFYRLFESKYDVLLWCEDIPLQRGLAQMGRTLTCTEGIEVAVGCFDMFSAMFLSTDNSSERRKRERSGIKKVRDVILETLSEYHDMTIDDELDYQAIWCAQGTLVAIRERRERNWDPATFAKMVASCYPQRILDPLNAPPYPTKPAHLDFQSLILG